MRACVVLSINNPRHLGNSPLLAAHRAKHPSFMLLYETNRAAVLFMALCVFLVVYENVSNQHGQMSSEACDYRVPQVWSEWVAWCVAWCVDCTAPVCPSCCVVVSSSIAVRHRHKSQSHTVVGRARRRSTARRRLVRRHAAPRARGRGVEALKRLERARRSQFPPHPRGRAHARGGARRVSRPASGGEDGRVWRAQSRGLARRERSQRSRRTATPHLARGLVVRTRGRRGRSWRVQRCSLSHPAFLLEHVERVLHRVLRREPAAELADRLDLALGREAVLWSGDEPVGTLSLVVKRPQIRM